ncbi:hypothetical protein PPMP20_05635 [Paraburkholderia phymatum]|uniref:Uncharacterized protein n=1 Tax=Paraburkholderia phymatum (strain DSM 17167 / CIP 108236 / LMG 21445 / STM815) TaxID=391038 RepID=B2JKA3_PARP8|nr:hypothetical protein [Paraburkholderia phymatum]ACC70826.1 hypothetical protein Bphy_1644 [Paraburkholderia phymatum STM815]
MTRSLSADAIDTLRQLNDVGTGQTPPAVEPVVEKELLVAGLVAKAGKGAGVEITCDGRKYLSGDCD